MRIKSILLFFAISLLIIPAIAQEKLSIDNSKPEGKEEKKKLSFIDPVDGYFDVSQFVLQMHGFIPVPIIITEPAVGGFGLGVVPVFIQRNDPIVKDGKTYPVSPTMTMLGGAYTANGTWLLAGGRVGHIKRYGIDYKAAIAYADANLDFYQYFPKLNQTAKFGFNMEVIPVYLYLGKKLWDPRFSVGVDYVFADIKLKPDFGLDVPEEWVKTFESKLSTIGLVGEFDSRDNTFTPNSGIKASIKAKFSSEYIGSDHDVQQLEEAIYWYVPFTKKWVSGFRVDFQQIYGDYPFYMKPYVDMRGIPALRYQGENTALVEVEERYDIGSAGRWSVVGFGGLGKGFDKFSEFNDMPLAWSYGVGGRYLISRILKLRVGVDVAMGPEGPTYYIIFGSGWMRQ